VLGSTGGEVSSYTFPFRTWTEGKPCEEDACPLEREGRLSLKVPACPSVLRWPEDGVRWDSSCSVSGAGTPEDNRKKLFQVVNELRPLWSDPNQRSYKLQIGYKGLLSGKDFSKYLVL